MRLARHLNGLAKALSTAQGRAGRFSLCSRYRPAEGVSRHG